MKRIILLIIFSFTFSSIVRRRLFSSEINEFLDRMHNTIILEKNPIYKEVIKKHYLLEQQGVGKEIFKRVLNDFFTYNLNLTNEEKNEYNKAFDLMLFEMPEYIRHHDYSYWLNEVKFNYILDALKHGFTLNGLDHKDDM